MKTITQHVLQCSGEGFRRQWISVIQFEFYWIAEGREIFYIDKMAQKLQIIGPNGTENREQEILFYFDTIKILFSLAHTNNND